MDTLLIRPVEEEDLGAVVGLLHQLNAYAHTTFEIDTEHVRRLYSAMLTRPQQYKNLVACMNGEIVGLVSVVYYVSFYHQGGTALVNELIVSKERRNAGIGKALVQHVISMSRNDSMDEIEVGTEKGNERAIAFYKNAGFDEEYVLLGLEFKS
jgi:ribosomal protein S18 acetylase RimI-like enzyme